jgi:hypothetical protein
LSEPSPNIKVEKFDYKFFYGLCSQRQALMKCFKEKSFDAVLGTLVFFKQWGLERGMGLNLPPPFLL